MFGNNQNVAQVSFDSNVNSFTFEEGNCIDWNSVENESDKWEPKSWVKKSGKNKGSNNFTYLKLIVNVVEFPISMHQAKE